MQQNICKRNKVLNLFYKHTTLNNLQLYITHSMPVSLWINHNCKHLLRKQVVTEPVTSRSYTSHGTKCFTSWIQRNQSRTRSSNCYCIRFYKTDAGNSKQNPYYGDGDDESKYHTALHQCSENNGNLKQLTISHCHFSIKKW